MRERWLVKGVGRVRRSRGLTVGKLALGQTLDLAIQNIPYGWTQLSL